MVSKWRLNVADMGMSGSDWLLAARVRGPGPGYVVVVEVADNPVDYWVYTLLPGDLPVPGTPLPKAGKHFPYGWDVEPDR